jgi:hypothetical protein
MRRARPVVRIAAWCASLYALVVGQAIAGPSIGQFELKDLEADKGSLQFQSQNAWSWGQPRRAFAVQGGGEVAYDENTVIRQRHALEMEMGYSRYFKTRIGIEFEKERLDDPDSVAAANSFDEIKLSEIGGEAIAVLVPRNGDGVGLGAVVEVEHPLETSEPNSIILGPIVELASGPWSASFIPMFVRAFGGESEDGERRDNKWDFAYAAQLAYAFSDSWTLTLEAYGTVDRIGDSGHRSESAELFGDFDQHRAGPILYYAYALDGGGSRPAHGSGARLGGEADEAEGSVVTIGAGILAGLNENTPDATAKLSVEVDF